MKNAKRTLALASMTLAAGAMLGITPAQASPATAQTPSTDTAKSGPYWDWDDEYVVGYYFSKWECYKAGWWGEKVGAWGDYYCYPAWVPGWGHVWVLQVEEDHWYWNSWNGYWPQNWPYKPNYVAKPFHVGGQYQHPFKFKKGIKYGKLNGYELNPYKKFNGPQDIFEAPDEFVPPKLPGNFPLKQPGFPQGKPNFPLGQPDFKKPHQQPNLPLGQPDFQKPQQQSGLPVGQPDFQKPNFPQGQPNFKKPHQHQQQQQNAPQGPADFQKPNFPMDIPGLPGFPLGQKADGEQGKQHKIPGPGR